MFNFVSFLEPIGMFCGMLGAIFISFVDLKRRMIGYVVWIVSNVAWVTYAIIISDVWLCLQFVFYFGTTSFGIYNIVKFKKKYVGKDI